jgi:hypothetical protein
MKSATSSKPSAALACPIACAYLIAEKNGIKKIDQLIADGVIVVIECQELNNRVCRFPSSWSCCPNRGIALARI